MAKVAVLADNPNIPTNPILHIPFFDLVIVDTFALLLGQIAKGSSLSISLIFALKLIKVSK